MELNNGKQAPMAKPSLPANYESHRSVDPLPSIPHALLNAYDIIQYVNQVGIVAPFDPDRLKPASYEVPFAGTVYWWDPETLKPHVQEVNEKGDSFHLKPNAIAYVYLSTVFFLPKYIAVRFNLRITHVHQGLLLGTGPLVDPGFCGNLLVPLHNLTANPYSFNYGEGFIWVEFTKVSPFPSEDNEPAPPGERRYGEFPKEKLFLTAKEYFAKANSGRSIVSSVLDAVRSVAEKAEFAKKRVTILEVSLAILLLGIIASVAAITGTVQTSVKYVTDSNAENTRLRLDEVRREIQQMRSDLERKYDARLEAADKSIETLKRSQQKTKPIAGTAK
jgi:deoxycytidine triphosphate deaminase